MLLLQTIATSTSIYAQNNSSSNTNMSSIQNQTAATLTGQPESVLLNKTTIPAEQTIVTVNQTTEQIQGQADLQPIGNQTIVEQAPQLSNFENKTMVESTGPAVTTIVNQTTVPFNQTTLGTGQAEELQQTGNQSNQTSQQQQQQPNQSSQNQGPLEQLGESTGNIVGGGGGQ
ncbi:hypothetical protein YTPLAS21_18980 [Candidatus Nitrosocosmicus sp.]|nr:hypothetical protein YTPLAS21_18980 [Candidatus Nitrosocosmicus sp.]